MIVHYGGLVHWAAIVTAAGAVLGGLALPLAFIQLGAQRQDRLRAQVSKIGVWAAQPLPVTDSSGALTAWALQPLIRNNSQLPVLVEKVVYLAGLPKGNEHAGQKPYNFQPGTIAPADTWTVATDYVLTGDNDRPEPPTVSVSRVLLTDAAGYSWEIRAHRAGPPRRVRRWRRTWWALKARFARNVN